MATSPAPLPPVLRRVVAPVGAAAVTLGAWVVVAAADPNRPASFGRCPVLAVTGAYCPLCGGLRAAYALAHGDLATAIERNVLLVAALPVLAVVWVRWLAVRAAGSRADPLPGLPRWGLAALVLLTVFAVARNTPWGSALAP